MLGAPLLGLTPWTHAQHTIRGLKEGYRILKTGLGKTELGTTGLGLALGVGVMSGGWVRAGGWAWARGEGWAGAWGLGWAGGYGWARSRQLGLEVDMGVKMHSCAVLSNVFRTVPIPQQFYNPQNFSVLIKIPPFLSCPHFNE